MTGDASFKGRTIGVVGAGKQVFTMHLPLCAALGMEPKWIVDVSEHNAESVARAYGIPLTLHPNELEKATPTDIVLLACPYGARKPYYDFFRNQPAAWYVEKPVARTLQEHRDIAALRPDYAIGAGFLRRSQGTVNVVKGLIEGELFGTLRRVRSEFGGATQISSGSTFGKSVELAGGGQLLESAIHNIDTICYAAGVRDAIVLKKHMVHEHGFDLHTEAEIELHREQGPAITLELLATCFRTTGYEIEMTFDNAVLSFSLFRDVPPHVRAANSSRGYKVTDALLQNYPHNQYDVLYAFWRDFLCAVDARVPNYTNLSASVTTTNIIEQLYGE